MSTNHQQHEHALMMSIGSSIVKCVFLICITVMISLSFSSCEVNKSTIEQCEVSCKEAGTTMVSVTSWRCVCDTKKNDPWVLPIK